MVTMRATVACLVVLVAPIEQGPSSSIDTHDRHAANPAIQAFVRHAIADRFAARDIPDFGMLPESGEILIRQETGYPNSDLTFDAMPQISDRPFRLIQESVAQARADATATSIVFITVGRVVVNTADATINLGVDTVDPRSPSTIKLCCCSGDARYRRVGDQWKFVGWDNQVCS